MRASKFSEAQVAYVLRQAEEGTAIGEVCRATGTSEATFYNWRKKNAELMPSEMKRFKQLEEENAEEAGGRSVTRPGDAAGCHKKKAMRPGRRVDENTSLPSEMKDSSEMKDTPE
jgi:putative transposase